MSGTIAAGSLSEIGFVAEPIFGATPTGSPFQRIRDVSFGVNLQKEIYMAEERRTDRSRSDLQFGYHSLSGEIVGEMSLASWDDFISAALGGTWANPTPVELPIVVSADPVTSRITSLTSTFDINSSGIRVGDIFTLTLARPASGLTDVLLTVMSTTASTIDVEAGTISTTVTAVTATRAYTVGKKTGLGTTNQSFTLERWLTDKGLYQQFSGVQFNQLAISVPASGLVSIGFSIIGRTATTFSSTTVASTYTVAPETIPFTTVNGSLYEGSRLLGIVTGAEILVNNNMVSPQIVGTNLAPTIFFGAHADITGTMSVLFTGPDMYDEFINETETTLVLRLQSHSGALTESSQFINIVLPRIKYTGAEVVDGGGGAVTVTLPFVALTPLESKPFHGTQAITFQASNTVSDVRSFDFTTGFPSDWTISRGTVGTYFDINGNLQTAAINTARLDYDPTTARTNLYLYSQDFSNAYWNKFQITASSGFTAPDGTATAFKITENSVTEQHALLASTTVSSAGTQHTLSAYFKAGERTYARLIAYNMAALGNNFGAIFNLSAGSVHSTTAASGGTVSTATISSVGDGWYRCAVAGSISSATVLQSRLGIINDAVAGIYAGDGNSGLYVWGAQLETAASATAYIPTGASTVTICAVRGILAEPQRANYVRNNTMVNAVVGAPGTLPTGWGTSSGAGLSREIVGVGTVNGISYIDVRISGTPTTSSLPLNISFEAGANVPASQGQVWTTSLYMALVSGSLSNVSYVRIVNTETDNAGTPLVFPLIASVALDNVFRRYSGTYTIAQASTTRFVPGVWVGQTATSVALDFTIRFGMPQHEIGGYATSIITTNNTGAGSRSADRITYDLGTWWQRALGASAYGHYTLYSGVSLAGGLTVMGASKTGSVGEAAYTTLSAGGHFSYRWVDGATVLDGMASPNFGTATKQAFSITRTSSTHVISTGSNDGVPNLAGYGTLNTFGMLSPPWSGGAALAGWIHNVTLYNYPQTVTQLRALVT